MAGVEHCELERFKSLNSDVRTFVKFVNRCHRNAALYWYDFKGGLVRYAILTNGDYMRIDTFVTHPWCARDADTGDRLLIDKDHVYFPVEPNMDAENQRRFVVFIDLPVYTLKERCKQEVIKNYKIEQDSNGKLDEFLPKTVLVELNRPKHTPCRIYKGHQGPVTTALVYSKEDTEILLKTEDPGTYLLYRDHDTDILYLSVRSLEFVEHHQINFEDNLYYMDNQPYPYLDSIVLYHQKHKLNGTRLTHHAQLSARAVKSFTMRVTRTGRNGHVVTDRRQSVTFSDDNDGDVKITGIEHTNDVVLGKQRISKSSGRLWMSGMQKSMKRMSFSDSYNFPENNISTFTQNGHVFGNGHVQSYDSDSDDIDEFADNFLGNSTTNGPVVTKSSHINSYDVTTGDDDDDIDDNVIQNEIDNSPSSPGSENDDPVVLYCSHL